jgi:hypothetical protein
VRVEVEARSVTTGAPTDGAAGLDEALSLPGGVS